MIKKLFHKIILFLCRRDIYLSKLRKYQTKSIILFVILLIFIGLDWKFKILVNGNLHISIHINQLRWWIILSLQNSTSIFFILYNRYLYKFKQCYMNELLMQDCVIVGFKDDQLKVNEKYYINHDFTLVTLDTYKNYFGGNWFFNSDSHSITHFVDSEKIFKFLTIKEYRRLKLKKLKK